VCRFHVAASEKLHADKISSAIVRSVAKLAGINLRKCGSFSYWFNNIGFTTEGKLAAVLIITFSWGFPTSFLASTIRQRDNNQAFFGAVAGEKEDFCKGSLSLLIFYFVIVLIYFIFACIVLSKIQKN
jgi:hypothetical protein